MQQTYVILSYLWLNYVFGDDWPQMAFFSLFFAIFKSWVSSDEWCSLTENCFSNGILIRRLVLMDICFLIFCYNVVSRSGIDGQLDVCSALLRLTQIIHLARSVQFNIPLDSFVLVFFLSRNLKLVISRNQSKCRRNERPWINRMSHFGIYLCYEMSTNTWIPKYEYVDGIAQRLWQNAIRGTRLHFLLLFGYRMVGPKKFRYRALTTTNVWYFAIARLITIFPLHTSTSIEIQTKTMNWNVENKD